MDVSFDVFTAQHDDVKRGGDYPTVRSRVVLDADSFSSIEDASATAGCLAVAIHGGMPIKILIRL